MHEETKNLIDATRQLLEAANRLQVAATAAQSRWVKGGALAEHLSGVVIDLGKVLIRTIR